MRARFQPRRPIRRPYDDGLKPFPTDHLVHDDVILCPNCGGQTIQHTERTLRWWNASTFWQPSSMDEAVLIFNGSYDTADDGDDQEIACWSCGGRWSYLKTAVEFS